MKKIRFVLAKYDGNGVDEYLAIIPTSKNDVNPGNCMIYASIGQHSEAALQFIKENCKTIRKPSKHGHQLERLVRDLLIVGYTRDEIPVKFLEIINE